MTGPSLTASFVYDGDGARVKSTINGVTTYFVGSHYEKSGSTVTKYYYAGSQRIAMRKGGTLSYLLSDHLGSTSITTNSAGALVSELRYKPWGETRYSNGTTPTKYTYTGQYSNVSDFGLLFYNARWYDPALGRFAQADSIVPGGVQGYDRYAYVNNNPVRYTDPSGHCIICFAVSFFASLIRPAISTALGNRPDMEGIALTMMFTDTKDNAVVAAGLAVQSEYPWALVGGSGTGLAQATSDETGDGNPYLPSVAEKVMEKRITSAIGACTKCQGGVDNLIVAAIAQNGYDLDFKSLPVTENKTIDWNAFFESNVGSSTSDPFAQFRQKVTGMDYSAEFMLKLYIQDLRVLMKHGYDLPNWATEEDVKYIEDKYIK